MWERSNLSLPCEYFNLIVSRALQGVIESKQYKVDLCFYLLEMFFKIRLWKIFALIYLGCEP